MSTLLWKNMGEDRYLPVTLGARRGESISVTFLYKIKKNTISFVNDSGQHTDRRTDMIYTRSALFVFCTERLKFSPYLTENNAFSLKGTI
jgi:hypothetical protein